MVHWYIFAEEIHDMLPSGSVFYNFNYNTTEPLVLRTSFGLKGVLSQEVESIGHRFIQILDSRGWQDSLISHYIKQSLCEGYYEWNRLTESAKLLSKVEKIARHKHIAGLWVPNRITQSRHDVTEGKLASAKETINEAPRTLGNSADLHWIRSLRANRARINILDGRLDEAEKELNELHISSIDKPMINRELEYTTLARLLNAQGRELEALTLLEQLKPQAQREGYFLSMVGIPVLQALIEYGRNQRQAALLYLHEALTIGNNFD